MKRARRVAFVVFAGSLATSGAALASPLDTYGFGSRETAMGGAVTADAKAFSAAFYNPAGPAFATGLDLSFGYFRVDQRLSISGKDTDVDPVKGVVFGLVAPGKILGVPFAFALAAHLPDDRLSRVRTQRQDIPRWELYNNRAQILFIASTLAVRPVSWLSIGGGVGYLSSTRGSLGISGQAELDSPYDSQLRHEVDADLTSVRIPLAGIRAEVSEKLAFGLAYRGEAKLDLHIDADIRGTVHKAKPDFMVPVRYTLTSQSYDAFHPRQLALGATYAPTPRLRANLDLVWTQWSAYKSATSLSTSHIQIDNVMGLVAVPPDPRPSVVVDPSFSDRIAPHLGLEVLAITGRWVELPVRAGYVFERSPVPPQTGITNFVDADRHTLSLGVGARFPAPIEELPGEVRLDLHGAYSLFPTRTTTKDSPADFVGNYTASGHQTNIGATLGVGF